MSKYTPNDLKTMAAIALDDKAEGGMNYMTLIMTLCIYTGLSSDEVERRINQLANTGVCE